MSLMEWMNKKFSVVNDPNYNAEPKKQPEPQPKFDKYFETMEQLEMQWSVLSNLKIYTGPQADDFEQLCKENIQLYKDMVCVNERIGAVSPAHAPGFVRLAMLYENRKDYLRGIEVCADAINCGAYSDHSSGKMYGRLARLIRKSGIQVSDSILQLCKGPQ